MIQIHILNDSVDPDQLANEEATALDLQFAKAGHIRVHHDKC